MTNQLSNISSQQNNLQRLIILGISLGILSSMVAIYLSFKQLQHTEIQLKKIKENEPQKQ